MYDYSRPSPSMAQPLPSKRARTNYSAPSSGSSKSTSLNDVPLELLAAILDHLPSPRDILAVARTSQHLAHTLLNPSNQAIWRRSRERCPGGPVPAPPSTWSEPAHAAFVFDGGKCEICGHHTSRMYMSFAIRARVCSNSACRRTFATEHTERPQVSQPFRSIREWLPYIESLDNFPHYHPLAGKPRYYRKKSYLLAMDEYNRSVRDPTYTLPDHAEEKARLQGYMEHMEKLAYFRYQYESVVAAAREHNSKLAREFAKSHGWQHSVLYNTRTFDSMRLTANACAERLTEQDIERVLPEVRAEQIALINKRSRRDAERARQKRRGQLIDMYRELSANPPSNIVMPSLEDFRRLPVVKTLQEGAEASGFDVAASRALVVDALVRWTRDARDAFAQTLGYPAGWLDPSERIAHVVERPDAYFICTPCGTRDLDFAHACAHRCEQTFNTGGWKASNFAADADAARIMRAIAAQRGVKIEEKDADMLLRMNNSLWACTECAKGAVVMSLSRIVPHARRHPTTSDVTRLFRHIDPIQALAFPPYEEGLSKKLLNPNSKKFDERREKAFVCRLCYPGVLAVNVSDKSKTTGAAENAGAREVNAAGNSTNAQGEAGGATVVGAASQDTSNRGANEGSADASQANSAPRKVKGPRLTPKKPVPMILDGFICHMRARHNIDTIGDEDFYRIRAAAKTGNAGSK